MKIDYTKIDDEIVDLIKALNESESPIKTKYCCSGHKNTDRLYIMFSDDVKEDLLIEWFKNFTKYSISYNGKFLLNHWSRWVNFPDNPEFKTNWIITYEENTAKRRLLLHELLWFTKEFMNHKDINYFGLPRIFET